MFPCLLCSGVNAVSSSAKPSCIYSGGADGMVCEIDPNSGNLIRKFKASTKAVSSLSVSPGVSLGDLVLPLVSSNILFLVMMFLICFVFSQM